MSPKKELILFVREHSLVNNSGKVGIADEGPMAGYSDCPQKKNYNYSSGINHLLARAVGGHGRRMSDGWIQWLSPKKNLILFVWDHSLA